MVIKVLVLGEHYNPQSTIKLSASPTQFPAEQHILEPTTCMRKHYTQ